METLGAVRAYVHGEGQWSKAQKAAVLSLERYARSGDEADFEAYRRYLAIPRADRVAREELDTENPDMDRVYRAFVAGRNDPEDVADMARLYRWFQGLPYMRAAIATWAEADEEIVRLATAADSLRAVVRESGTNDPRAAWILADIHAIDRRLTELEDAFSSTMNEGSRRLKTFVLGAIGLIGLILFTLGTWLASRMIRRLRHSGEALAESENRMRQLATAVRAVLWLTDPAERKILYVSPGFEEIWGMPVEELVDDPDAWLRSVHPEDRERVRELVLLQHTGHYDVEYRIVRPDGETRWIHDRAFPVDDEKGEVVRLAGLAEDVTDRIEAEEALTRARRQVVEAQKMEAVGRLAGGVAHDFNNLLTVIQGYAAVLLDRVGAEEQARASLEEIRKAARTAADLTGKLLAFGRHHFSRPEVVDLGRFVVDHGEMLDEVTGEDVRLHVETAPGPILIDPSQLEQVVMNLVINARDAMPRGGELTIRTMAEDPDVSGARVVLEVRDTGVGIPEEQRPLVFEPFYTTKQPGEGTGLGLSTTYAVVEQSGGEITFESEPGEGTVFRVQWPRAEEGERREEHVAVPPVSSTSPDAKRTVLVVEDEVSLGTLVERFLESGGYGVLRASDPRTALEIVEAQGEEIDLLLTDVVMPGMSGPELASRVRRQRPGIPVIFMTGYAKHAVLEDVGDARLVRKPFTRSEILEQVGAVVGSTS